MKKSERDRYWTEFIQTCRVSGLSDYEWQRVPIHYNELKDNNSTIPNYCDEKSDIKIEFNRYSIAINNSADNRIIAATLNALQQIC